MASLLGKADPTLVTAAARAGLANVPGDYSKQFGIMADANKDLLTGVEYKVLYLLNSGKEKKQILNNLKITKQRFSFLAKNITKKIKNINANVY